MPPTFARSFFQNSRLPALVLSLGLALAPEAVHAQLGLAGAQIFQQGAGGIPGAPDTLDQCGEASAAGDCDGDGFDDVAVGLPFEDVGETLGAGAVNALYGAGLFRDGFESSSTGSWSATAP